MKKHLVVLTGAGMSADSGIQTFRDAGGLWEGHRVEDVATPEAYAKNPDLVLEFYNLRRRNLLEAHPNAGHLALAELEARFKVSIITQNVDDLHERAGSSSVLHLHGELFKVRSTKDASLVYEWKKDLKRTDLCDLGSPLRPHIVWFGEAVPAMEDAMEITEQADLFVVIGTSLQVYPAAGLINYTRPNIPRFLIDPKKPLSYGLDDFEFIQASAAEGTPLLKEKSNPYA